MYVWLTCVVLCLDELLIPPWTAALGSIVEGLTLVVRQLHTRSVKLLAFVGVQPDAP